ncbi:hypothetical protein PGB90_010129 [Kerria lacca]
MEEFAVEQNSKYMERFEKIKNNELEKSDIDSTNKDNNDREIYNQLKSEKTSTISKIFNKLLKKKEPNMVSAVTNDDLKLRDTQMVFVKQYGNVETSSVYSGPDIAEITQDINVCTCGRKKNIEKLVFSFNVTDNNNKRILSKYNYSSEVRTNSLCEGSSFKDLEKNPNNVSSSISYRNPKSVTINKYKNFIKPSIRTKTTRAQVFREQFIKKKMLNMASNKNDSWWKNFNVKLYYKSFKSPVQ